jgi:TPP-dependent pyruvate/acetoin dehydrogenase alpha subunit
MNCTAEELIAFEQRIKAAFAAGDLPFLVHLSGGNEAQLIDIFRDVQPGDWIFSGHRSHYHYLLAGGSPDRLEQLIRDGRSMFVFDSDLNFVTSAILAGLCCPAAGVALALKQSGSTARVWCFLGDGAEDNGHFAEAVRYATGHDLPVTFVIEDNDRQVDTGYAARWGTAERFNWGPKVRRYHYTPTFPHGGAGLPAGSVKFNPEVVARFTPKD